MKQCYRFFQISSLILLSAVATLHAVTDTAKEVPESVKEIGSPFLCNYSSKEYGAAVQNWAIVQDRWGVIYVGNNLGVLEFDGARWRLIPTKNKTVVRSLAVDDAGRVYVGAQGEIGYLAPDETKKMRFVSLNNWIDAPYREFSDILRIYATPQGVYFQARECLLLLTKDRIQAWKPSTAFHLSFYCQGRLFIRQFDVGMMELVHGKLALIPGGEHFAQEKISTLIPWDEPVLKPDPVRNGRILIGTRTQGLFLFEGASITPFPTEADAFLRTNMLSHGVLLKDGTLAFATIQGGMALLSRDGKLLGIFDKASGLPTNTVYRLQPDGQSGLWLALDKGISRVEWPAPLTLFDERSGLKGSVISLHRHMGTLYAGTSQGVYLLEPDRRDPSPVFRGHRFKSVEGISAQCWGFLSYGGSLLMANFRGVFEIRGDKSLLVRPSNLPAMCLLTSRSDPSRIFVGLNDGVASMYHRGEGQGRWVDEGKIPGITEEVRTIVEMEDGRLWLGTDSKGLIRITFPRNWKGGASGPAPLVERFGLDQGLPRWKTTFTPSAGSLWSLLMREYTALTRHPNASSPIHASAASFRRVPGGWLGCARMPRAGYGWTPRTKPEISTSQGLQFPKRTGLTVGRRHPSSALPR